MRERRESGRGRGIRQGERKRRERGRREIDKRKREFDG